MMRRTITRTEVQTAVDRLHELTRRPDGIEYWHDYHRNGERWLDCAACWAASIRTILATLEEQ